jgi:hypothetical protein
LRDLERCLGGDESDRLAVLPEAQEVQHDESIGLGRELKTARTGESKPDFGLHAGSLMLEANTTAHPMASTPAPKLSHAYDPNRFGSQEELLNRLRQTRHNGVSLWGLLQQL